MISYLLILTPIRKSCKLSGHTIWSKGIPRQQMNILYMSSLDPESTELPILYIITSSKLQSMEFQANIIHNFSQIQIFGF